MLEQSHLQHYSRHRINNFLKYTVHSDVEEEKKLNLHPVSHFIIKSKPETAPRGIAF